MSGRKFGLFYECIDINIPKLESRMLGWLSLRSNNAVTLISKNYTGIVLTFGSDLCLFQSLKTFGSFHWKHHRVLFPGHVGRLKLDWQSLLFPALAENSGKNFSPYFLFRTENFKYSFWQRLSCPCLWMKSVSQFLCSQCFLLPPRKSMIISHNFSYKYKINV